MIEKINLNNFDPLDLAIGQQVLLYGTIITGRDAAHQRLQVLHENNQPFPVSVQGKTIYYVGACPAKPGEIIGSCGPTTASRMDFFTPTLLQLGLKAIIAKGKRSDEVAAAIKQHGAAYFTAIGGAGAFYVDCITECKLLCFEDLLSEAIYQLKIENFPAIVSIV